MPILSFIATDKLGFSPEDKDAYKKLLSGDNSGTKGQHLKKLKGQDNLYSLRLSQSDRLLFTYLTIEGEAKLCLIGRFATGEGKAKSGHKQYEKAIEKSKQLLTRFLRQLQKGEVKKVDLTFLESLEEAEEVDVKESAFSSQEKRVRLILDKLIIFSDAQEKIDFNGQAVLIHGVAGSGKTSVALKIAEHIYMQYADYEDEERNDVIEKSNILYVTRSPHLAKEVTTHFSQVEETSLSVIVALKSNSYESLALTVDKNLENKKGKSINDFISWCEENKIRPQDYGSNAKQAPALYEKLYKEFRLLSACENEGAYLALGGKLSLFKQDEALRKNIFALYQRYHKALIQQQAYDLNFYDLAEAITQYKKQHPDFCRQLIIDEAQNLSRKQVQNLMALVNNKNNIAFCMDSNQSIKSHCHTREFIEGYYHGSKKSKLESYHLAFSYRTPKNIALVASLVIRMRQLLVGKEDKSEYSQMQVVDGEVKPGQVQTLSYNDLQKQQETWQAHCKSSDWAIVVADENQLAEAKDFFQTELIFTAEDIIGRQYPHIIAYLPFEDKAYAPLIKKCEKDDETRPIHRIKDKTDKSDEPQAKKLNAVFVGLTRAEDSVTIVYNSPSAKMLVDYATSDLQGKERKILITVKEKSEDDIKQGWIGECCKLIDTEKENNIERAKRIVKEKKLTKDDFKKSYQEILFPVVSPKSQATEKEQSEQVRNVNSNNSFHARNGRGGGRQRGRKGHRGRRGNGREAQQAARKKIAIPTKDEIVTALNADEVERNFLTPTDQTPSLYERISKSDEACYHFIMALNVLDDNKREAVKRAIITYCVTNNKRGCTLKIVIDKAKIKLQQELKKAIDSRCVEKIIEALNNGAEPVVIGGEGRKPLLLYLINAGQSELAIKIIPKMHKDTLDVTTEGGMPLLFLACDENDPRLFTALVNSGANINCSMSSSHIDGERIPLITKVAIKLKMELFQFLLARQELDVNTLYCKYHLIFLVISQMAIRPTGEDKLWEVVGLLVDDNRVDLRQCLPQQHITIVERLLAYNNIEFLKKLVQKGLSLRYRDSNGNNAFHMAITIFANDKSNTNLETLSCFLHYIHSQIPDKIYDINGLFLSPLMLTIIANNVALMEIMLSLEGIDINVVINYIKIQSDDSKITVKTILGFSLSYSDVSDELIIALINAKNINLDAIVIADRASDNYTALQYAILKGRKEIVKRLLEKGASTSVGENSNATVFHLAASIDANAAIAFEMIKLFVESKNIDNAMLYQAGRGITPLSFAFSRGHEKVVNYFCKLGAFMPKALMDECRELKENTTLSDEDKIKKIAEFEEKFEYIVKNDHFYSVFNTPKLIAKTFPKSSAMLKDKIRKEVGALNDLVCELNTLKETLSPPVKGNTASIPFRFFDGADKHGGSDGSTINTASHSLT